MKAAGHALAALALASAPFVSGHVLAAQDRPADSGRRTRELTVLGGRGAEIGVRIAETDNGGVRVEEVEPDSPADKAGVKRNDVIVEFDGERVRSGRQFARVVQETPAGRSVKATVMRDGRRQDLQITPSEGHGSTAMVLDGNRFLERLPDIEAFRDRMPFNFNFDLDLPGVWGLSGMGVGRLGATVDELTTQLAQYFGAKGGVLVAAVTDGSPAARAGLKAGDVITSINGHDVRSRDDLTSGLRDASSETVTLGVTRDRKELTVTVTVDPPRRPLRGARPI